MIDAAAIVYFEKISFADALYFTFVTGVKCPPAKPRAY